MREGRKSGLTSSRHLFATKYQSELLKRLVLAAELFIRNEDISVPTQ